MLQLFPLPEWIQWKTWIKTNSKSPTCAEQRIPTLEILDCDQEFFLLYPQRMEINPPLFPSNFPFVDVFFLVTKLVFCGGRQINYKVKPKSTQGNKRHREWRLGYRFLRIPFKKMLWVKFSTNPQWLWSLFEHGNRNHKSLSQLSPKTVSPTHV